MGAFPVLILLSLAQTDAALAATAPPMGVVQQFGVLGATGVTATNPVVVTGDVGSSPTPSITGSVTVVPPFILHTTNDAVVQQAQIDATAAVSAMTPQGCDQDLTGQDLGTVATLTPGVYCFSAAAGLTGTLTLSGSGVYIFRIGTTLTTAGASNVAVSNGADSGNVFWQIGAAANLGVSSTFRGNIFAGTSIGLGAGASLVGRAVAQTGAVTLDGSVSVPLPSITIAKSVVAYSDPANATTNPKAIPGSEMLYTITMTNSGNGAVDNDTTVVTDPIPANTALYVSDINGAGSGPVHFTDGTPVSGLTYTFTALGNMVDDVDFSNDSGATWVYVPTPGADGCDPLVTNLRIIPKGTFVGNATPPSPSLSLNFRVCVK